MLSLVYIDYSQSTVVVSTTQAIQSIILISTPVRSLSGKWDLNLRCWCQRACQILYKVMEEGLNKTHDQSYFTVGIE